jgi:predicted TIM-barrel fold metal-dependent hydrolase
MTQTAPPPPPTLAPAIEADYNRTGIDFRAPMPWPRVKGPVIDFHCHLFAARHAKDWFEAARHYGIDCFVSMTPLEEVAGLLRDWPGRLYFIAVPQWMYEGPDYYSDWLRRIEMFYNLGSRIVKFHAAPQTILRRDRLDSPRLRPIFDEIRARKMMIMTHVGDPELWYQGRYADTAKYGTREEHYRAWEHMLEEFRDTPWIGAHLGGNPENFGRLQYFLDKFPNLVLDCSATRWMAREVSQRRDEAREFFIRNADRILFGSDQVSGDDRGFDFLASRWWTHRKLWETAYVGPMPIADPDLPSDNQPMLRGLALPDDVLQKLYHDNAVRILAHAGITPGVPA